MYIDKKICPSVKNISFWRGNKKEKRHFSQTYQFFHFLMSPKMFQSHIIIPWWCYFITAILTRLIESITCRCLSIVDLQYHTFSWSLPVPQSSGQYFDFYAKGNEQWSCFFFFTVCLPTPARPMLRQTKDAKSMRGWIMKMSAFVATHALMS